MASFNGCLPLWSNPLLARVWKHEVLIVQSNLLTLRAKERERMRASRASSRNTWTVTCRGTA